MITDKHLLKLHDDLIEQHKKWIAEHGGLTAMAIMITKDNEPIPILMKFNSAQEKMGCRDAMKKILVEQDIKGYFFCCDAKMTLMDTEDPLKSTVQDAVIHNLFTPKGNKLSFIIHDEKKVLDVQHINEKDCSKYGSEWDLWGKGIEADSQINKDYQKFKDENPEEFKSVS